MTRLDWLLASLALLALIGALVWIVWLVTASPSVWPSAPTATEAAVVALIKVSPQGTPQEKAAPDRSQARRRIEAVSIMAAAPSAQRARAASWRRVQSSRRPAPGRIRKRCQARTARSGGRGFVPTGLKIVADFASIFRALDDVHPRAIGTLLFQAREAAVEATVHPRSASPSRIS